MDKPPQLLPPSYPPAPDYYVDEPESGGLLEYWRIIRRRRGTLILIAFIGTLLGVLFTLPQTPVYQARTSLEIQELNQDFLNIKQLTPVTDGGNYTGLTDIQTQIKILQSESLLKRTAAKVNIRNVQETGRVSAWRQALNLPTPSPAEARQEILETIAKQTQVRAAGQTRIVEVLVDSTDRQLAVDFANTLATEFIEQNMEARWLMTRKTGEWLQRQLEDMRIKLELSEDGLQRYARRVGLMFTGDKEKTNINDEKLRQLQTELSKAQADRVVKQSRFELARTAQPDALADVLNDTGLRGYQTTLTDLRRQRAELATLFTPEHTRIKRLEAQIVTLDAALARERGAIVARIQNDYAEAARREALLTADYRKQSQVVTQEAETSIQYNILKREVDSNRQLYEAMLQRVKEASIAAAMKASNVRVVDPAEPPKFPYKPKLSLNAALGLLAGLFLGIAFIVMRERADRTFQDPGDAGFYLNLPELGVIPLAASEFRKRFHYNSKHRHVEPLQLTGSAPEATPETQHIELVTWQRKPSGLAESFRSVLTSVLFSDKNGDRPRMIVLTSASPSEGKTTLACNLAIALAEIHQKVLLIDGDMRKPRLHELLGLDNARGLSTLLDPAQGDAVNGMVQQTRIPGLSVLPAGPTTAAATNLLYSKKLKPLLEHLKGEYDMLLVDTPPMLHMPDARVMGRLADAVILVARAGATTRDSAQATCQRLASDSIPVLGVVLNAWNPNGSPGYQAYYKGYSHSALSAPPR